MKKLISLFLVTLLCVSCCVGAHAQGNQLQWQELSFLGIDLNRYYGIYNNAEVSSTATCGNDDVQINMRITITQWNGKAYIDTSTYWTESGSHIVSIAKKFHLSEGNYIARVDLQLYYKDGTYIETITSYSDEIII